MKKAQIEFSYQIEKKKLDKILLDILQAVHDLCEKKSITYMLFDGTLLGAVRHKGFIPWDDDVDIVMPRKDFDRFLEIAQEELGTNFFIQTVKTEKVYPLYHIPLKVRDNSSTFIEEYNKTYHQGIYIDIFPLDVLSESWAGARHTKRIIRMMEIAKSKPLFHDFPSLKWFIRTLMNLFGCLIPHCFIQSLIVWAQKKNAAGNPSDSYTYGFETPWNKEFSSKDLFPPVKLEFEGHYFFAPNNSHNVLCTLFGDYRKLPDEKLRIGHAKFYSDMRLF